MAPALGTPFESGSSVGARAGTVAPTTGGLRAGWRSVPAAELRTMYRAYSRRQCRRMVAMLPRDRIRPLYREALAAGSAASGDAADPLELLVEHCASFLPLPPFRVWLEDLARYPEAHLRDVDESADAPTPAAPATLVEREFHVRSETWRASLRCFRSDGAWRAFIAFHGPGGGLPRCTAVIFREPSPESLRARFLAFESATLEAFLRSCSP